MKTIVMKGVLAIDTDGMGDHHQDKTAQNRTSGKMTADGKIVPMSDSCGVRYLNADTDNYAVAPQNLAAVKGGSLSVGDLATVTLPSGKKYSAPIGDFGPAGRAGEFSLCAIKAMGVDVIFSHSGPIPTLDGGNASDIHVTVEFAPGSAT